MWLYQNGPRQLYGMGHSKKKPELPGKYYIREHVWLMPQQWLTEIPAGRYMRSTAKNYYEQMRLKLMRENGSGERNGNRTGE